VAFALEAALRLPDAAFGSGASHGCGLPPWRHLGHQVLLSTAANTFSQSPSSTLDDMGHFDGERLLYGKAPGLERRPGLPSSVL